MCQPTVIRLNYELAIPYSENIQIIYVNQWLPKLFNMIIHESSKLSNELVPYHPLISIITEFVQFHFCGSHSEVTDTRGSSMTTQAGQSEAIAQPCWLIKVDEC